MPCRICPETCKKGAFDYILFPKREPNFLFIDEGLEWDDLYFGIKMISFIIIDLTRKSRIQ
jgi:hypothetical protein